ncbi:MAG: Ku protein, partial [Pseudomonadota bacterium]|nr:Ku protein [Pseudomonadota bacterium]
EVAAAVPDSDKALKVSAFLACRDIDDVYFDKPYYLAPADRTANEAFALIRDGMRKKNVAAIARTVLFRRVRTVLIRAHDDGLIATTLNFDYEVRSSKEAFEDIPAMKIKGEMLELAEHIIKTKMGKFDVSKFDDRYEAALADLVKAKLKGKKIEPRKEARDDKVVDLMAALRESAGRTGKKPSRTAAKKKTASRDKAESRRKAG